jgi:hypothetical protein
MLFKYSSKKINEKQAGKIPDKKPSLSGATNKVLLKTEAHFIL